MPDEDMRALEREARASRDDVVAWTRYVRALKLSSNPPPADLAEQARRFRAGLDKAPWLATIRAGDEVWVDEHESPWIVGRWRGIVTKVYLDYDEPLDRDFVRLRVRPVLMDEDPDPLPYRVRPLPEHRVRGFELGREDRVELIARAVDERPASE